MSSSGLPPAIMSFAMTVVWTIVAITNLPFAVVASFVLGLAWKISKVSMLSYVFGAAVIGLIAGFTINQWLG